MENISGQSDSQKRAVGETSAGSDSDSGDSLFLTQSVTSAERTLRRRRPSSTPDCPFSQESDTVQETHHEDTGAKRDSDSDDSYSDLLRRWTEPSRIHASTRRKPRRKHRRAPPKRMVLPFLKKSDSGKLCINKNRIIVNSEIGGFFKCALKLSKGQERNQRELSPSLLPSEWKQNNMKDDDEEDVEDIRKVDTQYFVLGANRRNRQTWQPFLKWKTRPDPKCTEKSKGSRDEKKKSFQTREAAEDLMELQDDTDIDNESILTNVEKSRSRKTSERSSQSSDSPSSCSTDSQLFPKKSHIVQNLFMDLQEEHTENQAKVLVTCSQSQSLDWHQAQKVNKARENLMEPIEKMAVEETQWPNSADYDDDETQILEDVPVGQILEGVHHEPVENMSVSGVGSQDLFQEPNNQASPLKENIVVQHDTHSIVRIKRCSVILIDVKRAGGIDLKTKGKNVELLKKPVDTLPETCDPPKSRLSDQDSLMVCASVNEMKQKKKRKKDENVGLLEEPLDAVQEISASADSGLSALDSSVGGSKIKKKRKKDKHDHPKPQKNQWTGGEDSVQILSQGSETDKERGLLEEPVEEPETGDPPESRLSVEDSSVACASVNGSKLKKKRKKDKHSQPELQKDQWTGGEDSVQIPSQGSSSLMSIAEETELSNVNNHSSPEVDMSVKAHDKPDKDGEDDALSLENVSSREPQGQILEGVHHEPVENEDLGGVSGGCSQDLFQEPNNQASPLKESGFENIVVNHDAHSPVKVKRCSVILTDEKRDHEQYFKSQKTQPSEISRTDGDQEKNKKTADDREEHVCPSAPLEDNTTGSRGRDYSSPSKDVLPGQLEETRTPLFKYGGITFLKRKKTKKTDHLPPGDNLGPNEDSAPQLDDEVMQKNKKELKSLVLLEEQIDTLPEIGVSNESSQSVEDSSLVCALVKGNKQKKKRTKDKSFGLLQEPVDALQEFCVSADSGLSGQDCSVICASAGESKLKQKRKKDKNVGFLEEPVDALQEISVSADSGLSVQDSLMACASVNGMKQKKKRKKDKNVELLKEPVDTLPETSDPPKTRQSDQDSSTSFASVNGMKRKKKRKKDKNVEFDALQEISASTDSGLSALDSSVGGSKLKKKRKKNQWTGGEDSVQILSQGSEIDKERGLLEEPVDTLPETGDPPESRLSDQDSSVACASVNGSKLKKKRKKDKHSQLEPQKDQWTGGEDSVQIPSQGSSSLVSIAEETELSNVNNHSSPEVDMSVEAHDQSDGCERRKKKKKEKKKREDSSPVLCNEMFDPKCTEESLISLGTKTKKKKRTCLDDEGEVGEMFTASKDLGEPLDRITEAGKETANNGDLMTDDCGTVRKKKKRKRQEVVRVENVDVVEITEQVETQETFQDSEQQAAEVVVAKKQKKKKHRSSAERHQEEEVSKNPHGSLGPEDTTTSHTPIAKRDTGGIDEEEGLGEPVKKKKKKKRKRKELDNDESWSVSHGLECLHKSNHEQRTVDEETSRSKEDPTPCLVMELTNEVKKKKKRERSKGEETENSQDVLQADDGIQPNEGKKKKIKDG